MINPRLFLLPAALIAFVAPQAFAKEIAVSLTSDGDAEAPPPHVLWKFRTVRKVGVGETHRWEYDPTRTAPDPVEMGGVDIQLMLPVGPLEVQAISDNGSHGRVILEVNEKLKDVTWAITDLGEPLPAEGEPTQWYLSADTEGPQLTGAPPLIDLNKVELEVSTEELRAKPEREFPIRLVLPADFTGTVEIRDAKGELLHTVDAGQLAKAEKQTLPVPSMAGAYDLYVKDSYRRTVVRHVIYVKE